MKKNQNYNDLLNNLLAGKGSISEQRAIAKKVRTGDLIKIAPYSQQAREELEERRYKKTFFLTILVVVIALSTLLLTYKSYKIVSSRPELELYLNDKEIVENGRVVLKWSDAEIPLQFAIRNKGKKSMTDFRFHLYLPNTVEARVEGLWLGPFPEGDYLHLESHASVPLFPNSKWPFGNMWIKLSKTKEITVSYIFPAEGGKVETNKFTIEFD